MVYLDGALAVVLLLFSCLLFKFAVKGKGAYRNIAAVITVSAASFTGYYIVAFLAELARSLMDAGT